MFVASGLMLICSLACGGSSSYSPQSGDIVFHTSMSAQSEAIQRATDSRYSHVGVVWNRSGEAMVFEAVEPVRLTPLSEWVERGEGGHFVAKRLERAEDHLTEKALARMFDVGRTMQGRHYDLLFEWSDDRIYCSELVWKLYDRGLGIELAPLERVRDFDLGDAIVRAKVNERFGADFNPDEPVISPSALFHSPWLETVFVQN